MMTNRLQEMYDELSKMAEREAYKCWRLAWRAKRHGCQSETVEAIRNEAWALYHEYTAYPERLLANEAKNSLKYAFCGERIKHTYLVVNEFGEIIRMERR